MVTTGVIQLLHSLFWKQRQENVIIKSSSNSHDYGPQKLLKTDKFSS